MERDKIDVVTREGSQCFWYEYYCQDCKQLRISSVDNKTCGHCGSRRIVKGKVNTLLKE